jgi:hypothetical protein
MQNMRQFDPGFLLDALKGAGRIIKKEALKALSRDKESQRTGIRILLGAQNFWGSKNGVILENMSIIEELVLKESAEYLAPFAQMRLFWHAPLKNKARKILKILK